MRLYNELAPWFHLITHPSEYADEADHLLRPERDEEKHGPAKAGLGTGFPLVIPL